MKNGNFRLDIAEESADFLKIDVKTAQKRVGENVTVRVTCVQKDEEVFEAFNNFCQESFDTFIEDSESPMRGLKFKHIGRTSSFMIDTEDGLLIQNDKILAGHSAKREKTYMGAVRVALFDDKEHRDEIARALKKAHIKKILILGTSEKMVLKIAMRLQLPQPQKIIRIEDIATREEIEKAIKSRQVEGKHVIPVPSIEIKRNYPQIFSNSIKVFFRKNKLFTKKDQNDGKLFEKSIVQPEFSKKGRIEISEAALTQMVMHCVSECDEAVRVKKMTIKTDSRTTGSPEATSSTRHTLSSIHHFTECLLQVYLPSCILVCGQQG